MFDFPLCFSAFTAFFLQHDLVINCFPFIANSYYLFVTIHIAPSDTCIFYKILLRNLPSAVTFLFLSSTFIHSQMISVYIQPINLHTKTYSKFTPHISYPILPFFSSSLPAIRRNFLRIPASRKDFQTVESY